MTLRTSTTRALAIGIIAGSAVVAAAALFGAGHTDRPACDTVTVEYVTATP